MAKNKSRKEVAAGVLARGAIVTLVGVILSYVFDKDTGLYMFGGLLNLVGGLFLIYGVFLYFFDSK